MDDGNPDLRNPDGTWASGKSPNPGGQSKMVREMRHALREMLPEGVARLRAIITSGTDKDANAALKTLFDYTLTKPKTRVKVDGMGPSPLAGLTAEQLVALATAKGGG
jgi:hypothetical protein